MRFYFFSIQFSYSCHTVKMDTAPGNQETPSLRFHLTCSAIGLFLSYSAVSIVIGVYDPMNTRYYPNIASTSPIFVPISNSSCYLFALNLNQQTLWSIVNISSNRPFDLPIQALSTLRTNHELWSHMFDKLHNHSENTDNHSNQSLTSSQALHFPGHRIIFRKVNESASDQLEWSLFPRILTQEDWVALLKNNNEKTQSNGFEKNRSS